jgi:hypothetical protein
MIARESVSTVSTDIGPGYLADPARSADLGDGLLAMVGVNLDGDEWPWVMVAGAEDSRCSDDVPAHERTGRLPAEFRRRLGFVCPAITHAGTPCTRTVDGPGEQCAQHAVTRHASRDITRESHGTEPP